MRRDGHRCRVCDGLKPGVHHRVSGVSKLRLMIALCAGCHAKVHRTRAMFATVAASPLLLILWREQHPDGHEQTALDFTTSASVAQPLRLFEEEKRDDRKLAEAD